MAKIRIRFSFRFPRQWAAFFLTTLFLAVALLIALPNKFTVRGFEVTKFSFDLSRYGLPLSTELPLKQGLDIVGGTQVTLAAQMKDIPADERATALASVEEVLRRRVDLYGVSEPRVRSSVWGEEYRILVELPGLDQPEAALQLIGQTAQLSFREVSPEVVAASESASITLDNFMTTELGGKQLRRALVSFDPTGEPVVSLEFNSEGAKLFGEITERNVGQPLAIFLDDFPASLPVVNEPIFGGTAQISGNFTLEQAKTLAAQLNAGALPVPIQIVEQKTIGPSLGQRSLDLSVRAGVIGLGLVILFMILLYGWAGLIADLGLIAYGILTVALYKQIPVTLSLPGIAGLMLSIGMAVDANILTFERIKEEWRDGKSWPEALRLGFGRSWDSIRSANLATLAICFILFNPLDWGFLNTSGPVRGFALTLALGILVSLFTGVFYSRILVQLFLAPPKRKETP